MPSTISAGTTAGTAIAVAGDTTGNLAFQTNGTTTAMTVTTSQNVGIGTTAPTEKLDVVANSAGEDGAIVVRTQFGASYFGGVGNYPAFGYKNGSVLTAALGYDTNNNVLFTGPASAKFPAYLCRAWVNFNGTGTVTIRASGGVSSISDINTGLYRVNFTSAMPDANYGNVFGFCMDNASSGVGYYYGVHTVNGVVQDKSTTALQTLCKSQSGNDADSRDLSVSIFR